MLQKPQTHRRALLGYALSLPLAALLVMCTQPDRDQPVSETALATTQTSARKAVNVDGEIFTVVENQPEFPGGMKNLGDYLQKSLRYPESAQKANAEGRVFVNFIVTKTGEITDVNLLKGIGFGADEEAIRVVQNMPRWKPGSQSGQAVNVKYNLPINFELAEGSLQTKYYRELRQDYTTFLVNGKKVSFDEYVKAEKSAMDGKYGVEGGFDRDTKTASIKLFPKK